MILGQPAGLFKEVWLYVGADWLKLIRQSEGDERSVACELIVLLLNHLIVRDLVLLAHIL